MTSWMGLIRDVIINIVSVTSVDVLPCLDWVHNRLISWSDVSVKT